MFWQFCPCWVTVLTAEDTRNICTEKSKKDFIMYKIRFYCWLVISDCVLTLQALILQENTRKSVTWCPTVLVKALPCSSWTASWSRRSPPPGITALSVSLSWTWAGWWWAASPKPETDRQVTEIQKCLSWWSAEGELDCNLIFNVGLLL